MTYQVSMLKKKKGKGQVEKVLDISRETIRIFATECALEDSEWIEERMAYWIKEKGEKEYFPTFRIDFVNEYFSSLMKGDTKTSALDELKKINEAKRTGGYVA